MNTLKKVRAASLLLRAYCNFTIFFKNECHSPPQGCQKNWFSNFDLKLSIEIVLNENSLSWMFQIFFICFYPKMRASNLPVYIEKLFITVSQDINDEKIWNIHNKLFSLKSISMQSFESKFENQFFWHPWGGLWHSFLKNTVKVQYVRSNKLAVRTFSGHS